MIRRLRHWERRNYDRILDRISKPLMQAVREHVVFAPMQTVYPDGIVSNFGFGGADLAKSLWCYPDLGAHVSYLSDIISRTLTEQMREESLYLRRHTQARALVKEIVEMPDHQVDRVLRSIEQNGGNLSNVLAKEMPVLRDNDEAEAAAFFAKDHKWVAQQGEGRPPGRSSARHEQWLAARSAPIVRIAGDVSTEEAASRVLTVLQKL